MNKHSCRILCGLFAICLLCLSAGTASACRKPGEEESGNEPVEVRMMQNGHGVAVTELGRLTEENLKVLKEAGITFVKIHVPYPFGADGTPSNNYLVAKRAAKLIASCGLEVVCQSFTPGGHAFNASTGQIEWTSYLPAVFDDYDDDYFYKLIRQACRYIGKDMAEYCSCWIISNEPNLNVYTGPMNDTQIAGYINTCAAGIKEGDPKAYCGVNIFAAADAASARRLIPRFYGEGSCLDYLGLDSYFGTLVQGGAETWDAYIDTYYEMTGVPIMITEFSYSSYVYRAEDRKNDSHDLSYNSAVCRDKRFSFEWDKNIRSEKTQAKYATACLEIFEKHPEVIGWCWFSNIDKSGPCWECGDTNCPMESSWGLLRDDGTPKPVLEAIKAFYEK